VPEDFPVGSLVTTRGRTWTVEARSTPDFLLLRPTGGQDASVTGIFPAVEEVRTAQFPLPKATDHGPNMQAGRLRTAVRIGFESSAGPFRSLAGLAVNPRQYQLVPLLLALRQDVVRMLIADDVGVGKTIEAGLIAKELIAQGSADRLSVLCSPALAEQWQQELREKFGLEAELVLPSTIKKLERRRRDQSRSVFDEFPYTVVSTDFIKQDKHRYTFSQHCPELVIVDEAHSCVPDMPTDGSVPRHDRYDLVRMLARETLDGYRRHLILVTATPHSGKDTSFRKLIGLLDERFEHLDLDSTEDRAQLARHFVQRRRGDIRHFLAQDTRFPTDRNTKESPYILHPQYAHLFREVLDYARASVRRSDGTLVPRARWWAALALLRALASSPMAAAMSLENRAAGIAADTDEQADAVGRATVLDTFDDDGKALDTVPGGDASEEGKPGEAERRMLHQWAARARTLADGKDTKLHVLFDDVETLLFEGYNPIVFCRYIETAKYVHERLTTRLKKKANVSLVTGEQPPEDRLDRIDRLNRSPREQRQILVATDCLAEGVNLQERFNAVVHYDLAWNPTRHEQREGRVDRFGQPSDYVRALTIYGEDNGIDAIVLEVLLRKHAAIRKDTGVYVPVPDLNDRLIETIMGGVLNLQTNPGRQLALDLGLGEDVEGKVKQLHREWESSAAKEKQSRSIYAQLSLKPNEVLREVEEVRATLGDASDIPEFVRGVLSDLGAGLRSVGGPGGELELSEPHGLPLGLRHALGVVGDSTLRFKPEPPALPSEAVLERTDRRVAAIARYVIDSAMDESIPVQQRTAHRCGVVRLRAIQTETTLLVVRYRYHLELPSRTGPTRRQVAEDVRVHAYTGSPADPQWIEDAAHIEALLAVHEPDENTAPDLARARLERTLRRIVQEQLQSTHLARFGTEFAQRFKEAHRRVRRASNEIVRGLDVRFQPHADILGVYVFEPIHSPEAAT